jgi:pyruvate ferredoxin oxidoreductase beta subunit
MTSEPVVFLPTGRLTAGNRLLPPEQRTIQSDQFRPNSLTSGHRACQGCGEALGARYVLDAAWRATGGQMMVVNATGCLEVFSTPYPESSWKVPWMHSLFGNAASAASGMAAAMKAQGRDNVRVLAQAGDGATVDIGVACLSGMFERNDDVLYICYDNEGYMNTGVQRSASTPPAARTSTTQAIGANPGNPLGHGKDMPRIAMAHQIPFVATATVADPHDIEAKVQAAMEIRGARYLHVLVPCPLGWSSPVNETVKLARVAKESGIFPVYTARYGEVVEVSPIRRQVPVEEYLRPQGRFRHLFQPEERTDLIREIQAAADANIERFGLLGSKAARP